MYGTRLSSKVDLSGNRASRLEAIIVPASILVSVIDVEINKTAASFLAICEDIYLRNGRYSYCRST